MLDTNLANLIGLIDDKLSTYCKELENIYKREVKGTRSGFIITPESKSYPIGTDFKTIKNDTDNVYIPLAVLDRIEYGQNMENSKCNQLKVAIENFQDVKNNLAALNYTDTTIAQRIVSDRINELTPIINNLERLIGSSAIYNHDIKNLNRVLSKAIKKFLHEIRKISNSDNDNTTTETTATEKEQSGMKEQPNREINSERLRDYFISSFKGMGNRTINHFDTMIDELKTDRTGIEFAKIAYMIYTSDKMTARKPNTFSKWYRKFCECIGVIPVKGYKPNKLKNQSEKLKKLFSYI